MIEEIEKVDYLNLITKFLSEEISDNELVKLKLWLDESPDNRLIFDQENELWQETAFHKKHEYYKTEHAWSTLSSKLGLGKTSKSTVKVINNYRYKLLIGAASVACILALGMLKLYIDGQSSLKELRETTATFTTVVSTREGEKSHIYLADNTEVFLNSGSKLEYNAGFNTEERVVKLTGEAFFDVQTNPEKPFTVLAGQVTVSATGTKFNILSYENENRIETTLEEGVVQVAIEGKEAVKIEEGQQVVYFKDSEEVKIRDAAPDTYTSWLENKLRFYDTPFEEAMRGISRRYNVKIEITNRELLDLTYSATFIDESIDEVMLALKTISPITYTITKPTSVSDLKYTKPKIVIGLRKNK